MSETVRCDWKKLWLTFQICGPAHPCLLQTCTPNHVHGTGLLAQPCVDAYLHVKSNGQKAACGLCGTERGELDVITLKSPHTEQLLYSRGKKKKEKK